VVGARGLGCPRVESSRGGALVASLVAILSLVALLTPAMTSYASLQSVVLAEDGSAYGYKGDGATVTVEVGTPQGSFKVKVYVSGADAYDAAAVVLSGLYDDSIHKFVAFGTGGGVSLKNWHSFSHFESYKFKLESKDISSPSVNKIGCKTNGFAAIRVKGTILINVTHSTF